MICENKATYVINEPGDKMSPLSTSLPPNQSTPHRMDTPRNSDTGEARSRRFRILFFKLKISSTNP